MSAETMSIPAIELSEQEVADIQQRAREAADRVVRQRRERKVYEAALAERMKEHGLGIADVPPLPFMSVEEARSRYPQTGVGAGAFCGVAIPDSEVRDNPPRIPRPGEMPSSQDTPQPEACRPRQ
jgi:hypothetical protein